MSSLCVSPSWMTRPPEGYLRRQQCLLDVWLCTGWRQGTGAGELAVRAWKQGACAGAGCARGGDRAGKAGELRGG